MCDPPTWRVYYERENPSKLTLQSPSTPTRMCRYKTLCILEIFRYYDVDFDRDAFTLFINYNPTHFLFFDIALARLFPHTGKIFFPDAKLVPLLNVGEWERICPYKTSQMGLGKTRSPVYKGSQCV
jgi:hypothetical protein